MFHVEQFGTEGRNGKCSTWNTGPPCLIQVQVQDETPREKAQSSPRNSGSFPPLDVFTSPATSLERIMEKLFRLIHLPPSAQSAPKALSTASPCSPHVN